MLALVCLAGSGDAYVLFRWGDGSTRVEGRYFPQGDFQVQRWLRWLEKRYECVEWRYVGDREMDSAMCEARLTTNDFVSMGQQEWSR